MCARLLPVFALLLAACGPKVATLEVTPKEGTLTEVGGHINLKAEPKDEKGELNKEALFQLRWTSNDPKVAAVATNGKVTAVGTGDAIITVEVGKKTATAKIRVSIPDEIELTDESLEFVGLGRTATLTYSLKDSKGREVPGLKPIWLPGDTSIVTVDAGLLETKGPGKTTVTAKIGKLSDELEVEVRFPEVASIELDSETIELESTEAGLRLRPHPVDAEGDEVVGLPMEYASSNEEVATVSTEGLVRGVSTGTAKIQIRGGGKSATVEIVVP